MPPTLFAEVWRLGVGMANVRLFVRMHDMILSMHIIRIVDNAVDKKK